MKEKGFVNASACALNNKKNNKTWGLSQINKCICENKNYFSLFVFVLGLVFVKFFVVGLVPLILFLIILPNAPNNPKNETKNDMITSIKVDKLFFLKSNS